MSDDAAKVEDFGDIYTEFNDFLKYIIHEYYRKSGLSDKGNFIALLIASGEMGSLAVSSLTRGTGLRKLAMGAAGMVALRIGLKYALSGPLGILLAGATAASLVAYFVQNRKEIVGRVGRNRELVGELRTAYEQIQSDHRDRRLDDGQRNLMIDGLMKRFLADLER